MGFMGAEADGEQSAQYHDAGGASRFFPQFEDRGQLMQWLIRLICPEGGTLLDLRLK